MVTILQTFRLPGAVTGTETDVRLGHDLVRAWQADGILQVATDPAQDRVTADAIEASRRFFAQRLEVKARHVSDLSYSGYIASGEEVTAGEADYSEIFTVCKDLAPDDPRVQQQWPCHGPVPWPSAEYARRMHAFTDQLGSIGEKLLRLVALGLDLDDIDVLTRLTHDGWHHMRVLRFPALSQGYCVVGLLLVTASMRSWGRRLARLVARAMLVSPLLRWYPMAVLRRAAATAGPLPVRAWWASSPRVTSRIQCSRFSMCHSSLAQS
jgi:hypothetical protein